MSADPIVVDRDDLRTILMEFVDLNVSPGDHEWPAYERLWNAIRPREEAE